MNKKLDKINELIFLYDIYKEFLTNKQKEVFKLYYFEDYSFLEISELKKITKSAISDSISKTSEVLLSFEKKLKIFEKNKKIKELIKSFDDKKINEIKLIELLKKIVI